MANLNTKTISVGVLDILCVDGGIDASTARQVKDGDGTGSPFYITTTKVGIGTALPQSDFHLESADPIFRISDSSSTNTTQMAGKIEWYDRNTAIVGQIGYLSTSDLDLSLYNSVAGKLKFFTSATQRMTILSGGNVGIGTASPDTLLEVSADDGSAGDSAIRISSDDDGNAELQFGNRDSATNSVSKCMLHFATTNSNFGGDLLFCIDNTADSSAVTIADEAMRIKANGNVGIGEDAPGFKLEVNEDTATTSCTINVQSNTLSDGQATSFRVEANGKDQAYLQSIHNGTTYAGALRLEDDGDTAFYLYHDGGTWITSNTYSNIGTSTGTVVGGQSSDERLKNINSSPFPYGLEKVNKLIPIQFKWKDGRKKDANQLGFGAQTTQSILPEAVYDTGNCIDGNKKHEEHGALVSKNDNTELGMEYVQIIPVLVKAVQELSATVDTLSTKVTALENNNNQGENSEVQKQTESSGESSTSSEGSNGESTSGSSEESSDSASGSSDENSDDSGSSTDGGASDSGDE